MKQNKTGIQVDAWALKLHLVLMTSCVCERVHSRFCIFEKWRKLWCNALSCCCADGNGAQTHEVAHTTLITTLARQRGSGRMSTWWTTSSSSSRCVRTEPSTMSPAVHSTQHRLWLAMIRLVHSQKAGVSCLEHVHFMPLPLLVPSGWRSALSTETIIVQHKPRLFPSISLLHNKKWPSFNCTTDQQVQLSYLFTGQPSLKTPGQPPLPFF